MCGYVEGLRGFRVLGLSRVSENAGQLLGVPTRKVSLHAGINLGALVSEKLQVRLMNEGAGCRPMGFWCWTFFGETFSPTSF